MSVRTIASMFCVALLPAAALTAADPAPLADLPVNRWTKLTPLHDTPVSPRLGYEGACVWDSWRKVMIRYGGHNQGGGGEQNSEIWAFDPASAKWKHYEPNTSPPGNCCAPQNVFDPTSGLYIRFPAFSGSHGWQWLREVYLNDTSVWTYDLATNIWRNRRPLPTPHLRPLRCASWDSDAQVIVVFGGEGGSDGTWTYDPYLNLWRKKQPPDEPPGRSAGNMAYDAAAKQHVLFGTQFGNDPFTWLYDLSADRWTKLAPDVQPPTDKNDAVLTYDACSRRVLCITKQSVGNDEEAKHTLQTWAFDGEKQSWAKLDPQPEPDPSANRARQFMFVPEWNVALLENVTESYGGQNREQQVWAYRYGDAPALGDERVRPANARASGTPALVEDLVVSVLAKDKVELQWPAAQRGDVSGYEVERAVVEVYSEDQLPRLKSQTPPLESPAVGGIRRIGRFTMLTEKPIAATEFTDATIDLTKPQTIDGEPIYEKRWYDHHLDESGREYKLGVYVYRVRAVNNAGAAGGWSAATLTIPSAPQQVFAKEEGTTCHMKWKANPESGLAGYRVYRVNGQFSPKEIPRLTADPIRATEFSDADAGKNTRRYYVVAVDALGQEGFPSAPVWFEREWKRFYKPFTGEWHQ